MHKESVILLANPVYGWEVEKEYIWQDDAACAFQPPSMFEVATPGDLIADGGDVNEVHDLNEANLLAAQKVCNTCPVWDQCYTSAEEEDFRFTMRAGIMPTAHNMTSHGRPRKDLEAPCPNGHVDWKQRPSGDWYCRPCKAEYNKAQNAKRPKAGRPPVEIINRGETCQHGHDNWTKNGQNAKGGQQYQCRTCKNERDRVRRQEQRAAAKLKS